MRVRFDMARIRSIFSERVFKAMDNVTIMMVETAKVNAPEDTAQLKRQIDGKTVIEGYKIISKLICTSPYGRFKEVGTGPAAGHDKYMPPVRVILEWMKHRGIGASQKTAGTRGLATMAHIAYAIRWHIYQHGTEAKPFMAPARAAGVKELLPQLQAGLSAAIREARSELR